MKDHTVAITHTFDMGGEVETNGSVANGVHGLGIKEVMGPRWRKITTDSVKNKHSPKVLWASRRRRCYQKQQKCDFIVST